MNNEFERSTGPKKFSYTELVTCTKNWEEMLGFGGVYKGYLRESDSHIAVKRISRESKQGKKEYASEVRIISRLRHKNLLIVGLWCAHPDNNCRPSIKQAIQVLEFEAPLPTLPPNMPVPIYCSLPQYGPTTSFASAYDSNGPRISEIQSSGTRDYTGSSNNTAASAASSPSASLLYTR